MRAINYKLRQQIIKLIAENKRMNVTDIYVKLRLEQSVASQHLSILRRANIVITERDGKFIHYSLNPARIAAVAKFVNEVVHSEDGNYSDSVRASEALPIPPSPTICSCSLRKTRQQKHSSTRSTTNKYAITWRLQTARKPETRQKRMNIILDMLTKGEKFH